MDKGYHIVVCGGIAPDPLQRLEPAMTGPAPALKNELMLPAVLDPWAASSLYEAAHLAKNHEGSKVWLVSVGPKAKLQQVMMVVAQKVSFELVAVDAPVNGFSEANETAKILVEIIRSIPGLDFQRLLLFGGWESATRGTGATLQLVGEQLEIFDQFQGVDRVTVEKDGSLKILERIEGGKHQVSICSGPPLVCGWATGNLPEPPNNPQVGMLNMRTVMPALQRAKVFKPSADGMNFSQVALPKQERTTQIVKDASIESIAQQIIQWIQG